MDAALRRQYSTLDGEAMQDNDELAAAGGGFGHQQRDALGTALDQQQHHRQQLSDGRRFGNALLSFLLTQAYVVVVLMWMLMLMANYTIYLFYADEFALRREYPASLRVMALDFEARKMECVVEDLMRQVSKFASLLTTILPFG